LLCGRETADGCTTTNSLPRFPNFIAHLSRRGGVGADGDDAVCLKLEEKGREREA